MTVIASAWSRDGIRIYMRVLEFRGHDQDEAELIYSGRAWRGKVLLDQVVALKPECDCGMCSYMERALDREFPPRRRRERDDDDCEGDYA